MMMSKTPATYLGLKYNYFKYINYTPEPIQDEIHRFIIPPDWGWHIKRYGIYTANRLGKSTVATKEASFQLAPLAELAPRKVCVIAPKYELGEVVFREVYDDIVGKLHIKPTKKATNPPFKLWTPYGSGIEVWSGDNPDLIQAKGWDFMLLEKSCGLKRGVYANANMRISGRPGGMLGEIGTPTPFRYFSYDHYQKYRGQADGTDGWLVRNYALCEFDGTDYKNSNIIKSNCPRYSIEELEDLKRELSNDEIAEKVMGLFIARTGLVYPCFDDRFITEGGMVCDDETAPRGWERWKRVRCFDEGKTNPQVCLSVAISPDGTWYVYEEWYKKGYIPSQAVKEWINRPFREIEAINRVSEIPPREYAGGPDAVSTIGELREGGQTVYVVTNANKVKNTYRIAQLSRQIESKAFYVNAKCVNTINDFLTYMYKEIREGNEVKEEPAKLNDHAPEALERLKLAEDLILGGGRVVIGAQEPIMQA